MSGRLLYSEGDLFEVVQKLQSNTVLIPHVCNNKGAWGAGFVVPLGRAYPKAQEEYLKWHRNPEEEGEPFALGHTQFVEAAQNVIVCNMVAQTLGGVRPLRYDALVYCMLKVAEYSSLNENPTIECPLFGAGLAGGAWPFIHKLIQDCWTSRSLDVRVHYIPDKSPPGFMEWFSDNYVGEVEGGVEVQP